MPVSVQIAEFSVVARKEETETCSRNVSAISMGKMGTVGAILFMTGTLKRFSAACAELALQAALGMEILCFFRSNAFQ
jgi:hypothetical protein